jgi:hypothetical protein
MKGFIYALLLVSLSFFASSCNTYYVASANIPFDLYTDGGGSQIAYSIPTGTMLLLKGHSKSGLVKVRYHSYPGWYWVSDANLSLVPGFNPKLYSSSYYSYETNTIQGGGGYDATIQTGSRGGKYYINKNGNKTYVKRSTPSGTVKHVGGSRGRH